VAERFPVLALARLSNGEFVVNAASTKAYLPVLQAINAKQFAAGGLVGGPAIGSFLSTPSTAHIDQSKMNRRSKGDTHVHLKVIGDVSRQTKKHIVEMLPTITQGVNADNRESGYYSRRD
jgi:hypothetical protein